MRERSGAPHFAKRNVAASGAGEWLAPHPGMFRKYTPVPRVPKRVPSGGGRLGRGRRVVFAIRKAAKRYRRALPQYPRERETTPVKGRPARNAATFCMAIGAADSGSVEAAT
jgi:hypothetical protein